MNSKRLGEDEKKRVNKMKIRALKVEFDKKERERVLREDRLRESSANPTSLVGRVGIVNGGIEMV